MNLFKIKLSKREICTLQLAYNCLLRDDCGQLKQGKSRKRIEDIKSILLNGDTGFESIPVTMLSYFLFEAIEQSLKVDARLLRAKIALFIRMALRANADNYTYTKYKPLWETAPAYPKKNIVEIFL
jgi:hypothetical protein